MTPLSSDLNAALPRGRAKARWAALARKYAPAMALFGLGLLAWEMFVVAFNIEGFLLPRPSVIAATFGNEASIVISNGANTMTNAIGGFIVGSALGVGIALLTARWTTVREGLLPFAIAVNATPIVALAPIMNQWFGITNPASKMSIVAVIVFFPVMINMTRGLTLVDERALELMRSYAASEFAILRRVRVPNALPFLFSALKVATALSVIAAIVSEYFGGSRDALGVYISQKAALFRFSEAWSAIIVASAIGIAFYALVALAERLAMPWHASMQATDGK